MVFLEEEVPYLRGLAKEVRDISQKPEQEEKKDMRQFEESIMEQLGLQREELI